MIPVDTEARAYFFLVIVQVVLVIFLLVIVFRALNAADRADRRTRRAEAAALNLSERLEARKRALEHWKQTARPGLNIPTQPMRVVPLPEPAQRPGLSDTGDIT